MHNITILVTFAGSLAAALVIGSLAHRLKVSPIVGYLLAGVVVGPFTPGFVADRAIAEQFAEIGVILLLFSIRLSQQHHQPLAVESEGTHRPDKLRRGSQLVRVP